MNADLLLAHYERVADSPDAVDRIRKLIIDLAISGRLVEHGKRKWSEEPITNCLESLSDGKKIHQGWSPQCEVAPSPSEDIWGVLRTTAIQDGYFISVENKRLPDALSPKPHLEIKVDDILLTCAGPRARCGISCQVLTVRRRLLISGKMYRFRADSNVVVPGYLALFLRAAETKSRIDRMKTGSSESGLNLTQDRFKLLTVKFAAIEEQQRILAAVNKLMMLCDALESARNQREAARERLTAATLANLNTPDSDPDTFKARASFAIHNALPALTTRPDQIKQLRRTILNLAVRGLLTRTNGTDEDLPNLLKLIVEDGASRSQQKQQVLVVPPFAIPESWRWATLGQLIVAGPQNGLSPKPTTREDAPKAITLTATTSGTFDPSHFKRVEAVLPNDSDLWLREGDLLFQRGNTREYVGIAAIYTGPARTYLFPDLMIRVRVSERLNLRYVHLASIAPPSRQFLSEHAAGAQLTMPKINQGTLTSLPIPLPPRSEQDRIVATVDELMTLCDQLEASLARGESTRGRLFDALLLDALSPNHDNVIDFETVRQRLLAKREAVACRSIERLAPKRGFGRVRAVKALYFAEAHCGVALGGQWGRADFGPLDSWIYGFESRAKSAGWFSVAEHTTTDGGIRAEYRPGPAISAKARPAAQALGEQSAEFERVLTLLAELNTEESEIVATLYAAWNDLLLEGKPVSDEIVISEFREHWHTRKSAFAAERLRVWLGWMRKNHLVPKGQGPNTRHQPELI